MSPADPPAPEGAGLAGWVSSADRSIDSAPLPRAEAPGCRLGVAVAAHVGRLASWGVRAGLSTPSREIHIEIPSIPKKSPTRADLFTARPQLEAV